jgi:branched-chain amino acid transport system permease protein
MFGSLKLDDLKPGLILMVLMAAVGIVGTQLPGSDQRLIIDGMIKAMVVVGAFIFVGNSGVQSFGHVAFMGIGAYSAAWLTIPPSMKASLIPGLPGFLAAAQIHPLVAILAGGVLAAAIALVIGLPLSRLSGIAASIGTFAMLMIFYSVFANWTSVTGGQSSLYGVPLYTSITVVTVFLMITLLGAAIFLASPFGLRLRASREDLVAAKASGVDIGRERLIAFVLSAFFVGMAGALHAMFLQIVIPGEYYLRLTFIIVAMLVIGGQRSLTGALVGAIFVVVLTEALRRVEKGVDFAFFSFGGFLGLQEVGLAVVMLASLIFRPDGLSGGKEIRLPRLRLDTKTKLGKQST